MLDEKCDANIFRQIKGVINIWGSGWCFDSKI